MSVADPIVVSRQAGVVVVAKPPGLPTQAPSGIDSVESWARRSVVGPGGYLGIPHRLDRAVSGVLLLAETPRAARKLSRQFERRQIAKRYAALLACTAAESRPRPRDTWTDWVCKVTDEPRARGATAGEPGAREAVTIVQGALPISDDRVAVLLEPLTGRMHQLRLQAALRGTPVVGDTLYGGPSLDGAERLVVDHRIEPILLHALEITWRDPDDGSPARAVAPLPSSWPAAIAATIARLVEVTPAASPRG